MGLILIAILSLAIGFGIGCIPVVNQHLHWNIWFVIPISGAVFGMGLAALQFLGAFFLRLQLAPWAVAALAGVATAAYFATEVGIYFSSSVEVTGVEGMEDGEYPLRDLVGFGGYLTAATQSTTYASRSGKEAFTTGRTATLASYAVDMAGCFAVAAATLVGFRQKYPYCSPCRRYKRRARLHTIAFSEESAGADLQEALVRLAGCAAEADYRGALALIGDLGKWSVSKGKVKLSVDERYCSGCLQASLVGRVLRLHGNQWKEVEELAFRLESQPGEHTGASAATA